MKNDKLEFTESLKTVQSWIFTATRSTKIHDKYHLLVALESIARIARDNGLIEQ